MTELEKEAIRFSKPYSENDCVRQDVINAFESGAEWQKQKSIEVYRNLCTSYKIQSRYECGNYSHRQEWKTKVCDMNCQYMKNLMEKL